MSMIGMFGLCSKKSYDSFVNSIRDNELDEIEDLINKIDSEFESTVLELQNDKCPGEVFMALFDYFKIEMGIDVRKNMGVKKLNENWCTRTGDYDMIAFFEKEKTKLSSLAGRIDYDAVSQFVNDFFQYDYGDAGEIAFKVFHDNLGKLETNTVLIFRIC